MSDNALTTIEDVLITGNLATLNAEQRIGYYKKLCDTLKLNPLTKPFEYIVLNGKLVLYATKGCTDQLRKVNNISIYKLTKQIENDVYIVTAYARDNMGREDVSTGAVSIANLKGEALANAFLKCETKFKRRVTLSIGGLGLLDETEIESIKTVSPKSINEPAYNANEVTESIEDHSLIDSIHDQVCLQIRNINSEEDVEKFNQWKQDNKTSLNMLVTSKPELLSTYKQMIETRKLMFSKPKTSKKTKQQNVGEYIPFENNAYMEPITFS